MTTLTVFENDRTHVKEGKSLINSIIAKAEIESDATNHADNPAEAQLVARYLRQTADSYEKNECRHGHFLLCVAFEFANQLKLKGLLKLEPCLLYTSRCV